MEGVWQLASCVEAVQLILVLLGDPGLGPEQFMRHGHEMLWFLREPFSESELSLSYNAHSRGRARIQLIGYEINLLNKV